MRLFVLLFAMVIGITAGGFAMIETLSLEDMTASAEAIAVATLVKSDATDGEQGVKKLANTLEIGEVLKGGLKAGEKIVIRTIDGFEDEPVFDPRTRYMLFLQKSPDGGYSTVNLVQGAWPMDQNGAFLGMGMGTKRDALEKAIKATMDKKPSAKPASDSGSLL